MIGVSVVIPVYNGERFVEKAILSALEQEEVKEVLIVNDGSTDNTERVVKKLATSLKNVRIFNHLDKKNKGRSASRNLGIVNAREDYIAFLDADDFYLSGRFKKDIEVFENYPECDGIYNAVGFHYYDDCKLGITKSGDLYTVNKDVEPKYLFEGLLHGKIGHFQIDGLTVKKSLFIKTGLFDENLSIAEDTDIFWKMSLKGILKTGEIKQPVAMRGVHDSNIFYRDDIYLKSRYKVYESILFWSTRNGISNKVIDGILKRIWIIKHKDNETIINETRYWLSLILPNPRILFTYLSIKYFPIVRRRKDIFSFFYK